MITASCLVLLEQDLALGSIAWVVACTAMCEGGQLVRRLAAIARADKGSTVMLNAGEIRMWMTGFIFILPLSADLSTHKRWQPE